MSSLKILIFFSILCLFISQHCVSDVVELDKSGLVWPSPSFVPPWVLYPASRVYSSICLESYLKDMFTAPLNELTNITYKEIMDIYAANKCPFYLHGGLLRDILEGDPSHDVDIAFPCLPEEALRICESILSDVEIANNVSLCYVNSVGYMFIGRRRIDIGFEGKYWEDSFFHIENQEYTPNMLYYDYLNSVILDLTTGVEDIKNHQIRIPVRPALWDLWLYTANKSIGLEEVPKFQKWLILKKVCRYWKLRAKGYMDYDLATKSYLVGKVDNLWDSSNYPMKLAFKVFLCESLGGRFNNERGLCFLPGGFQNISDDKILFCRKYMHEIYLDFQKVQEGRIVNEVNEMVAYTRCHNFHSDIYGLFLERMSLELSLFVAIVFLMMSLYGGVI